VSANQIPISSSGEGAAVTITPFDASRDLARVIELHCISLPDTMVARLGRAAMARYYALVARASTEYVLVARRRDAIAGACVISCAPHTMLRRFAAEAPWPLIRELVTQLVLCRAMRRRLLHRLTEMSAGTSALPEVVQIFTDPQLRGRGFGSALLRAAEAYLRGRGYLSYCIHTFRDDNEAGIRFYLREGFTTAGITRSFGDYYLIMTKGLC
jgi:GNAT superfamily N-acetyltransferase